MKLSPSDFRMIVDFCIFEDCPKEDSAVYQQTKSAFGQQVADQFTYEVTIPPYEEVMNRENHDELKRMYTIITGGFAPANKEEKAS